jgi:hypothetical protein
MNLALVLAFCTALPASSEENFAFQNGTLAGWEGEGFTIAPAAPRGPGLAFAVCSGDNGPEGKTATLHRAFSVPAAGGYLRCFAQAVRSKSCPANENLDVVVLAAGKRLLPKMVRVNGDLKPVSNLLGPHKGRSREYVWDLTPYAGQSLRIAIIDQDKRRDCFVVCGGFEIVPADDFESREFGRFMHRLTTEHKLSPAARYESPHFIAYSNADEAFTSLRLGNCELIYELFFDHFRKRGFAVRPPLTKMMVAVFETQAGFLAYYGDKLPDGVTGLYHPKTNRLLVYDYGTNREFTDIKRAVKDRARSIGDDLDRRRYIDTFTRKAAEYRTETNISTIMHEVAHQLSFNCGLLNREGDVPFWLAEGLACYCEPTDNGAWQGIGEHNPERLQALQVQVQGRGPLIPLQQLIERDDFMRDQKLAILAYSQSWALFKMLIEERPEQFRRYLAVIHGRRVSGARLGDFTQAFGIDLNRLDLRYQEYIREMVDRYGTKKR